MRSLVVLALASAASAATLSFGSPTTAAFTYADTTFKSCAQPTFDAQANATHVFITMSSFSLASGDSGASNNRSTVTFANFGSSSRFAATLSSPTSSFWPANDSSTFLGACPGASAFYRTIENATVAPLRPARLGTVLGGTFQTAGCKCAGARLSAPGVVSLLPGACPSALANDTSVYYGAPALGTWLVRQSACTPGATGCSASCSLLTQALYVNKLPTFLALKDVTKTTVGGVTTATWSLTGIDVGSSAPFPVVRGVNTLQTRATTKSFTLTLLNTGAVSVSAG